MTKKQKSEEEKMYIPDTNVILDDGDAVLRFGRSNVTLITDVINEVESKKKEGGSVGVNARKLATLLDSYSEQASSLSLDMYKDGVSLGPGKGKLFVYSVKHLHPKVKQIFRDDTADHRIISAAIEIQEKYNVQNEKNAKEPKSFALKRVVHILRGIFLWIKARIFGVKNCTKVIFVSNDIFLRAKARILGLQAEKYKNTSVKDVYSGIEKITLSDELIDRLDNEGFVPYEDVREYLGNQTPEPYPYEFFVINDKIFTFFRKNCLHFIEDGKGDRIYGSIKARNDEQKLAMVALFNKDITAVTLSGSAGTGKTLMAIGAAIAQENSFHKIVITRKIVGLNGQDIGFLPGGAKDKVNPFMEPIYDNIDFIKNHCAGEKAKKKLDDLIKDESRFVVLPFAYIRGRTIPDACIIVDEAQNLTRGDVRAMLTRVGDNSKIILVGDPSQIDLHFMDSSNNGLIYAIDILKSCNDAAHVTLITGERSGFSKWVAENF